MKINRAKGFVVELKALLCVRSLNQLTLVLYKD